MEYVNRIRVRWHAACLLELISHVTRHKKTNDY